MSFGWRSLLLGLLGLISPSRALTDMAVMKLELGEEKKTGSQTYVILNEMYGRIIETSDNKNSRIRIRGDLGERQNPNEFVTKIMTPHVEALNAHAAALTDKITFMMGFDRASWAKTAARIYKSKLVVDCGSSKCQGDVKAPSLTELLTIKKAKDDFEYDEARDTHKDVVGYGYRYLEDKLLQWIKKEVPIMATAGIRTFAENNHLPFNKEVVSGEEVEFLTLGEIFQSGNNPMNAAYLQSNQAKRDQFNNYPVRVVSGEKEAEWEFQSAMEEYEPPGGWEENSNILFISMGGKSTQIRGIRGYRTKTPLRNQNGFKEASFGVGKGSFKDAETVAISNMNSVLEKVGEFFNNP